MVGWLAGAVAAGGAWMFARHELQIGELRRQIAEVAKDGHAEITSAEKAWSDRFERIRDRMDERFDEVLDKLADRDRRDVESARTQARQARGAE